MSDSEGSCELSTIAPYEDPGNNQEGFFEILEKKGNHWHSGQINGSEALSGNRTEIISSQIESCMTRDVNSSGNTPKITAKY